MSTIFYDHLLDLNEVDKYLKKNLHSKQERDEIYKIIDEIVHHRVVGCILDKLPSQHHRDFLSRFSSKPYDSSLLGYLAERISEDVEFFIRQEMYLLGNELLELIRPHIENTPKEKKR